MKSFLKNLLAKFLRTQYGAIVTYKTPSQRPVFELILKIHNENHFLMGYNEAYQLFMCAKRTAKIPGDIAEVGTYMGASAKLICEAKDARSLFVFDTFEGLPEVQVVDALHFKKGDFKSSYEFVKQYLSGYENVSVIKGLFPSSATPIKDKKFSFVNLDVDIYQSTKDCLEFFYTRMNPGGIILSHDYNTKPGVQKAFDEFFQDKKEIIVEMSGSQCLIVKI